MKEKTLQYKNVRKYKFKDKKKKKLRAKAWF